MGNEVKCRARFGKQESHGRALLETREIIFRGLQLRTAEDVATFELGASTAQKWREKILHPKTRIEKLGIKPGMKVSLIGFENKDEEFLKELESAKALVTPAKDGVQRDCDCILLRTDTKQQLAQVSKIARKMLGAVALWIIYPKGQKDITEGDVFAAGHKAGLTDIKVVGFSATHTALKFVIPVKKR